MFRRLVRERPWVVGLACLLALWAAVSSFGWAGRTLVASPWEVARVLLDALDPATKPRARILEHFGGTLERALAGWIIAVLTGTAAGLLAGARRLVLRGSEPMFELARSIPPVLVFPMLLVVFDFGAGAYLGSIVFGCLPVMALSVAQGTQRISPEKRELLAVFGVGPASRAFAISMEVLPSCVLGARLTLSLSLVIAVVTEMVFAPRSGIGLGSLAKDAAISFDTPLYYAAIVLVGAFGYAANALLRTLEDRLGKA